MINNTLMISVSSMEYNDYLVDIFPEVVLPHFYTTLYIASIHLIQQKRVFVSYPFKKKIFIAKVFSFPLTLNFFFNQRYKSSRML